MPIIFLAGLAFGAIALCMTTLVVTPMFLFSGVFFPVTTLPVPMQQVASVMPLTHAVSVVRPLMTGTPAVGMATHVAVLGLFFGAFLMLARALARRRFAR